LIGTSLAALAAGVALALGPWGRVFGFAMPPAAMMMVIAGITIVYLAAAEMAKRVALSSWQIRK
jgi:P-type Mg2+ transporter